MRVGPAIVHATGSWLTRRGRRVARTSYPYCPSFRRSDSRCPRGAGTLTESICLMARIPDRFRPNRPYVRPQVRETPIDVDRRTRGKSLLELRLQISRGGRI